MSQDANWDDIPTSAAAQEDDYVIRICINWAGLLEPVDVSPYTTVEELAGFIYSASECAVPEHKLFIYKGMLLPVDAVLQDVNVSDGSVLHLVLNDDPYQGRPLYVKCDENELKTIYCGADFYVEDIKEELSCFSDQPPPEKQRLVFAGRELQNQHTLREYNIQKPSVLLSIGQRGNGRQLDNFVDKIRPDRDRRDTPVDTAIEVHFCTADDNDTHFWGQMLGGPDVDTVDPSDLLLRAAAGPDWTPVPGTLHKRGRTVTFQPSAPLRPRTRYNVLLRSSGLARSSRGAKVPGIMHAKAKERVMGELTWDFFTAGYEPLRLSAVYPRPHSRVRCSAAAVVVQLTGRLAAGCQAHGWVVVRGHALQPPVYDPETFSLVYGFVDPVQPNEICRVRIREDRVRGAHGESLFPVQPDGLLRTATFRWKFYTGEVSLYEHENMLASNVDRVLHKYRAGLLRPLADGGGGGGGGDGGGGAAPGPWAGVPSLSALLSADDGGERGGGGGGGGERGGGGGAAAGHPGALAGWLNPSHILAGAVDALYGDEDGGRQSKVNWMQHPPAPRAAGMLANGGEGDDPKRVQWDF